MSYLKQIIDGCRVRPSERLRLKDRDPDWAGDSKLSKDERKALAETLLAESVKQLKSAQELLYASDTWSVLAIFQAPDAAGKDGTIEHVMSGVNPQGCQVFSFKQPSPEELDHDYLWRCVKCLPERGRIGIFNRSYYEEVLIVKVRPELLAAERIPDAKPNKEFWEARYEDISNFEKHLTRNGTRIVKFFLNVSKEEQRQRFLDRLNTPEKLWKFSPSDVKERAFWDQYQAAYEDALSATSSKDAPWYVVPADHKWACRAIVATILAQTIADLDLKYPKPTDAQLQEFTAARLQLEQEKK